MNDRCCEVDKTPTWDLKFLTDEGAVRNAAYFAAFARVAAVLTEYDALLDEHDAYVLRVTHRNARHEQMIHDRMHYRADEAAR